MGHHRVAETRRHGAMSRSEQALVADRGGPLAISSRRSTSAQDAEHKRTPNKKSEVGVINTGKGAQALLHRAGRDADKRPCRTGHGAWRFVAVVATNPLPSLTAPPGGGAIPPTRQGPGGVRDSPGQPWERGPQVETLAGVGWRPKMGIGREEAVHV
ncbi:hypothetical protein GGTG_01787 [Gaeumannomyces tritici R3-111a-1]|uniref:Uncharacterized protein n=1 Tax=Gaeumannomyces tritici (strain R3-111a-1) TaxID=644352 RepID=J3NKJ6_GAET3|nr:hypothetical protein GGTG_01787 [Gaeumannomyces tritici R3-111a-1]EJT81813.1 hypothetical protein GGTG_01787 [Gaeumannomyces tritici R3-111a-1]